MAAIRFVSNDSVALAYINKIRNVFATGKHFKVYEKVAFKSLTRLVIKTPKGFTGLTRQRWAAIKVSGRGFVVTNDHKVMLWLERGTQAHGPVRAKFLYIPLNRAAAIGGWHPGLQRGVDYILTKRVRGITAMNIVRTERPITHQSLSQEMLRFLREIT